MKRLTAALGLLLSCLVGASPLWANSLAAPDTVQAGPDGSFAYEWAFTVGPDSVVLAGAGWDGVENVPYGTHGDCFCHPNCVLEPGQITVWPVSGNLIDPNEPGTVNNWVAMCTSPDVNTSTTVLPHDPLPVLATTWGRIKALY